MADIFDLAGPPFLAVYAAIGTGVNLLLRWLIARQEKEHPSLRPVLVDPYKIACLRAGHLESMRVVLFSLIDRGLLKASADRVKAEADAEEMVRRPVEKAVVAFFARSREVRELFGDARVTGAAEEYQRALACEGLLADTNSYLHRMPAALAALLVLFGIAATKISIALSRGRHNILFLVILALVFAVWAFATWFRKRTGLGDDLMREVTERYRPLKERAAGIRPGGMTGDASYLAAVFGLAALPAASFPYLTVLFPRASSGSGGDTGGCGGGGCGSSGCGGGGCGGGCGGCGG